MPIAIDLSALPRDEVPSRFFVVNDRDLYNARYRAPVIGQLRSRGHQVETGGFLDGGNAFLSALRKIRSRQFDTVVSSNMKANILTMAFGTRRHVMILNGMGRLRGRRAFRSALLWGLRRKRNLHVVVQSYSDFRYLRRYACSVAMTWVPGSGGSAKQTAGNGALVLVQRDSKIALVAPEVLTLLRNYPIDAPLIVVGCEDDNALSRLLPVPHRSMGYLPASEIFSGGSIFLQPSGYGEGFPHTLADAIASRMGILISNLEALRYGLSRLGAHIVPVAPGWSRLEPGDQLVEATAVEAIASQMVRICEAQVRNTGK